MKILTIINKVSVIGKYLAFLSEWIEATKQIAQKHFSDEEKPKQQIKEQESDI